MARMWLAIKVFVPSKHLGFRLAGLDTKSNPSNKDLNNATEEESKHGGAQE